MHESPERPARGWWIDPAERPEPVTEEVAAALQAVEDGMVNLRKGTTGAEGRRRMAALLRSAARVGAGEHGLAVAAGLPLEEVRLLLRGA